MLRADGQDWVFFSLFPSFFFLSPVTASFYFKAFSLSLSASLSIHISLSFWLHPCLSHHVSGLLRCLAFSMLLSFLVSLIPNLLTLLCVCHIISLS